jgi:FlaG/FlaF family flagellin (archaellin)
MNIINKKWHRCTGISPIVSFVILISIVFFLAAIVAPWTYNIARDLTNQTGTSALTNIECRNAAYDFDTNYGNYGVEWNFSGVNDTLSVKIENTGTINLYGFSFQIKIGSGESQVIKNLEVNETTQKTTSNPLKPGYSAVLKAVISEDLPDSLSEVRVLNDVCSDVYISQEL